MTAEPNSSEPPQSSGRSTRTEIGVPKLFSGLRIVASTTVLSRILGMVRDMATAGLFGLSPVMDAFALAFRVPNLARRLFGEGALSAAFLPVFAQALEEEGRQNPRVAWQLATSVFGLLSVVLTGGVLLMEVVLVWAYLRHAGDADSQLALGLTAVMLPYAVLICLAAQVTAVLHACGEFRWPSYVPVVLNLCLLSTIWLVDPLFEPDRPAQAYALAVCVVVAGFLQLGLQWPPLRRFGYRFDWNWSASWPRVKEILRAVLPVTLGLSITQINTLLDSVIAWCFSKPLSGGSGLWGTDPAYYPLDSGAVSALYYGERMYQFPVGVFGVALGTVLFPLLARHAARGDTARIRDDLALGLRLVLMIGLPASVGLVIVAQPLARALFQHGDFTAEDTARTARMIAAYSCGVWAYCGIPILYRGFYAWGDRQFPVRVGMLAVALDLLLNLTLIWPLAERGLAVSTAVSAVVQLAILTWAIQSRIGRFDWRQIGATAIRTLLACSGMGVVCVLLERSLPIPASRLLDGVRLMAIVASGGLVFLALSWLVGLRELWLLVRKDADEQRDSAANGNPASE